MGATKQGASINVIRLVSFRKRPPLLRGAKRSARQRSWQHCQQLGDLLRVAGGVGGDATAESVDERAKVGQLDIVDSKDRECGMVESESFLDSTRRMVESWLSGG